MNPVILQQEVVLRGQDFGGRMSKLKLMPAGPGQGWLWRTSQGELVPLVYKNVKVGARRILFSSGEDKLNIFEHIGFLRYIGLLDVIVESNFWPPYFSGRGLELLRALEGKLVTDDSQEIKWYTLSRPVSWSRRGSCIDIIPREDKRLELSVRLTLKELVKSFILILFLMRPISKKPVLPMLRAGPRICSIYLGYSRFVGGLIRISFGLRNIGAGSGTISLSSYFIEQWIYWEI